MRQLPSICLAGRRYFLQMNAMLTAIMTARYTIEDMDSGVQILGWSGADMMWRNKWIEAEKGQSKQEATGLSRLI